MRNDLGRTEPEHDVAVRAILRQAFSSEMDLAESDLDAGPRPRAKTGASGSRPVRLGAVGLLVASAAMVIGLVGGPILLGQSPLASPTTPLGSPGIARYPDGIPTAIGSQAVLRGQSAIDAARKSTGPTSFLVALWLGRERGSHCVSTPQALELDGICAYMHSVGDSPGIPMATLGALIRFDPALAQPGPVVLRVHTHDPKATECIASDRAACDQVMVGEAVVWNGDARTDPKPYSVNQVERQFAQDATPTDPTACATIVAGVPAVEFKSNDGMQVGVVAVFPTAASLSDAYPDGNDTTGSMVNPDGVPDCSHQLTESGVTRDLQVVWFARDNLLLGVERDLLVPGTDPFVEQTKARLDSLR